jgi:hypothetical protein
MYSAGPMRIWHHLGLWRERVSTLSPRTILALGFACFVIYGFPGYMSTDSVAQLTEARTLEFSDGHPPLMAAEWAVLDHIIAGPVLMFLLQGALFLTGLYLVLLRVTSKSSAAWIASGLFVFPPVLVPMAVIWKDSQMAAYLLFGTALMLQPRLRTRLIGLGCLFAASALRHNAFGAVIPLVFFIFEWRAGIRWWKRALVLSVAAIVLVGAAFALTRLLAVRHVMLTPVYQDIVGVIARADERSDEEWVRVLRGTPLVGTQDIQERARKLHALNGAYHIVSGDDRLFNNVRAPQEWEALQRVREELVFGEPRAYLLSHWDVFAMLIGLGPDPYMPAPVWNLFLEDPTLMHRVEHHASWSRAQGQLGLAFNWLHENTYLFAPYIYGLVALLLLALCARDRVTIGLITSGLLYELTFFPIGVNADYRYSHWMITASCIATVLLFVQRRNQSKQCPG